MGNGSRGDAETRREEFFGEEEERMSRKKTGKGGAGFAAEEKVGIPPEAEWLVRLGLTRQRVFRRMAEAEPVLFEHGVAHPILAPTAEEMVEAAVTGGEVRVRYAACRQCIEDGAAVSSGEPEGLVEKGFSAWQKKK